MANDGNPARINLKASVNVDTVDEDVWEYGDAEAPAAANTGMERNGGVTNLYELEELYADGGAHFTAEDGQDIAAVPSGANRLISVGSKQIGQVSAWGVQSRANIAGVDDVALTADRTLITCKITGTQILLTENDLLGTELHRRTITFVNLTGYIPFYTSLSFVRYQPMHYADSQEWALRLGDQVVILKESTPSQSVVTTFASTSVLGSSAVRASLIWGSFLIVAGDNGRVGSFDGSAWRNYDGTGTGLGPFNGGTAMGSNAIFAIAAFGAGFAVGGSGGRLASFDGISWKNYDGTGSGSGASDNGTLIGSNQINALAVWREALAVGGAGGRIGAVVGTTKYVYTTAKTSVLPGHNYPPPLANADVIGANDIRAMAIYTSGSESLLVVAGVGGLLASFDGGWVNSSGTLAPTTTATTWALGTNPTPAAATFPSVAYGNGIWVATIGAGVFTSIDGATWTARTTPKSATRVAFGNGLFISACDLDAGFIITSTDGITWTARTFPTGTANAGLAYCSGIGLWAALRTATSTSTSLYTSPDGITWTARTTPTPAANWQSITASSTLFVAVALTTSTTQAIMTSSNGTTWTMRTNPAPAGNFQDVSFGNGLFVAVALTTLTTGGVMTSPDGITWTGRTTPAPPASSAGWNHVAYGAGIWVVTITNVGGTPALISSPDGTTWTSRTPAATTGVTPAIAFGGDGPGVFVIVTAVVSTSAAIARSLPSNPVPISNNATAVSTDAITSMLTDTSLIVIGSSAGKIASYNGTSWTNYNAGVGFCNNAVAVGANQVNAIVKFGTTYVFGAATGKLASWDGSNWKNADGTGTGTGVSNNGTVVGAVDITALSVLGSYLWIGSAGGAEVPMNSAGVFVPLYTSGSGVVANLLTGQSVLGYLYTCRHENGLYLVNLTGNNLSQAWILDNAALSVTSLKCVFAMAQVSGGYTRHVLVETPRWDSGGIYAVSLVGFTAFTVGSWTATQTYQGVSPAPTSLSATAAPLIGFNYVDLVFGGAGSDLYNYLVPQPVQPPSGTYARVQQGNTATNVNGYGKLNNLFGLPSSTPVEFRTVWAAGQQATLSVALLDGLASDCLGVLLTNLGEFDPSYTPQLISDDTLLYQFAGVFRVVRLGTALTAPIQKIAPKIYKLNTISPLNIVDTNAVQLCLGSPDYHGQMLFSSTATPAVAGVQVDSKIQDTYTNSIDPGDKLVFITGIAMANVQIFGHRLPAQQSLLPSYSVDTFIAGVYSFSTLSDGTETSIPAREDTINVPATFFPPAIGGTYGRQTVSYPGETLVLSDGYEAYSAGNELSGSYQVFILFGQVYAFDGQWIYLAETTRGIYGDVIVTVLGVLTRMAPADGLALIAVSPTAAYFLSAFDNSLYSFDGGRSVSKERRLTAMETITDGAWNVRDNTLLLQTASTWIWIRDNIATVNPKKASQAAQIRLYDTAQGLIVGSDAGRWRYAYEPLIGATVVPLTWSSAYFGAYSNRRSIAKSFVATIQASAGITGMLSLSSFDQDNAYTQSEPFTVQARDISSLGYARVRIQPKNQRGLGMQFTLKTNDKVLILDLTVLFEDEVNAPAQPRLTH